MIAPLPRLLLVEDAEPLRNTLAWSLRQRFEVVALAGAAEAVAQIVSTRFDVVLCDVRLRGMTGLELLRVARDHGLDVPFILMTGLPDIDGAIEAMDLGALTYLKKPFGPAVLDAALSHALQQNRVARASSAHN